MKIAYFSDDKGSIFRLFALLAVTIKEYGLRWPSTEGIISAVKRIFDECVKSHKKRNMYHGAKLKFWAYQKLRDLA